MTRGREPAHLGDVAYRHSFVTERRTDWSMLTNGRRGRSTHFGRSAERAVADFLEGEGWAVLGRNVRDGPREIDLVVRRGNVVAFVEVKARARDDGSAVASVDWRKRRHVAHAARAWVNLHGRPGDEYRFDVALAHPGAGGEFAIQLIPDAWRIGLEYP